MSGYIRLISGGAFVAVFVLSIIIFATQFAIDNDSDISIINDDRYTDLRNSLDGQLDDLTNDSKVSQDMLFKTTLEAGDEHSSTGAQFKIGPLTALGLAVTSFNTGFYTIFGRKFSFIATALVAMLTFIIGYFTIKAWLGRSPE